MAHLLHIDSSISGARSVTRKLTARAAAVWRAAHPGAPVTYRDLGADPLPHLDSETGLARFIPSAERTPAQAESVRLTEEVLAEVRAADTVLLGQPLYNYGPPSGVKSWIDHLVARGFSMDAETGEGLLGGRDFVVISARGGRYGLGSPRHGWDHAQTWLPCALSWVGMEARFVTVEMTAAAWVSEMTELRARAVESLAAAEREIDALWTPVTA
ncbi:FMN-dependent NADH-azoreductase [Amycolatopsis jiangsuensis]|uniref:FMN dependent NADH:quinone oxidoreductase n=1 Tax=Amycolatopsis jiangsuensis TaxID=1181879 RepID=A0A840IVM9_9PSEU|nr:NAD(P)H-dependent oxidoreductase [Amycolatopsis jiangsuensis]MBB4685813.1 FMN-dependent NADH-azoreductase [Amycolatopsis jiangsuensis]